MRFSLIGILCVVIGSNSLPWTTSAGEASASSVKEIPLKEALFLRVGGRAGRSAVHTDPVEALIVAGKWKAPVEGESFTTPDGTNQTWQKFTKNNEGSGGREGGRSGYLYWAVVSPNEQVMILHASGHSFVYVNGEIRAGDTYGNGFMRLPVLLRPGQLSVREIEAMAVGLIETQDETVISQSPSFIKYLVEKLDARGIPVILPGGALGCHVDARGFLPHVPQAEYPAGALAAAFFLASGVRGMERGTVSSVRDANGNDVLADLELLRLAVPRRALADRICGRPHDVAVREP